jgi:hypothetical protein
MKKLYIIVPVLIVLLLLAMISCEKSKSDNQNLSKGAEKFLELKTRISALNASSGEMSDFLSVIGRSQLKQGDLSISGTNVDSSYIDSISVDPGGYWGSFTCATVTESDNPDGTHTTVYDYGSGCDEYGTMYKGKVTYIWSNTGNNYFSKVVYEGYYCYGVTMNGVSEYSFTSDGNSYYSTGTMNSSGDSAVTSSPVVFNWSGSSTAHEDITMVINDTASYSYISNYSNKWDSISYTVLQGSYYCKNETAAYKSEYNYEVTTPLVTNYKCTDSWVPVSGVETITDTENNSTNTYSVDYGKGECDNLALLTENGKTSVIDFSAIYYQKVDSSGSVSPGEPATPGRKK